MFSGTAWIETPHLPVDLRGPQDRPYVPFDDPAYARPVLDYLRSAARDGKRAIRVSDQSGGSSHAELLDRVLDLTAVISAHPIGSANVGIMLPTGRDYLAAVFACIACGKIAVLLDMNYPEGRNAELAAQTGVKLLLTSTQFEPRMAWPDIVPVAVDRPESRLRAADWGEADRSRDLDAPALIICTSGSTGKPKAIVHSQRTMLHWVRSIHNALHLTTDDGVVSASSLSSLGGITPMFACVLAGTPIFLFDLKTQGIAGLIETLKTCPITVLRSAPSFLRGMTRLPDAGDIFAQLRIVQTYGEQLTRADVSALRPVLPPHCLIRSTYASTESSGLSWFVRDDDAHDATRLAAGALMPDTSAAILDSGQHSCRRGDIGELIIRSRYNALGEWIDGRVCEGRLVSDPDEPSQRIYRTGDLARCDDQGVFVVMGRADRMLNINGQRVEPAEIERVLRGVPGVAEAEVAGVTRQGAVSIVAFVVAHSGAGPVFATSLRAAVSALLPPFMIPARIELLDAIPRLPGGKVDLLTLQAASSPR